MNSNPREILLDILSKHVHFELADPNDQAIHKLLENNPMRVKGVADISYARRGGLIESYDESNQTPYFLMAKNKKIMGVVSEVNILLNGNKERYFYTSDLRVDPSCDAKTRLLYRKLYQDIIIGLENKILTCILDNNHLAINSLTNNKHFNYCPFLRYRSISYLVNPLIRLLPNQKHSLLKITASQVESSHLSFSMPTDKGAFFRVYNDTQPLATIIVQRPEFKKMSITPTTLYSKMLLKLASFIFSKSYHRTLPWVYLTVQPYPGVSRKDFCFSKIISLLFKQQVISNGEIIQYLSPRDHKIPSMMIPYLVVDGTMYNVRLDNKSSVIEGQFALNPLAL
jgi:hypothetical protein